MTSYPAQIADDGVLTSPSRTGVPRAGLNGIENALLGFVILSFAYEIPLVYITNKYKLNPYLFDVSSSLLIFYWLLVGRNRGWRITLDNPLLQPWAVVILTFFWATLVSATWVPLSKYLFSVYYFLQYMQGLVVLLILFSAPLDEAAKRRLLWFGLVGGTWVGFYATLQVFGIASTERVIPRGDEITQEGTGIFSTLGTTYFHSAYFGVLSALIGVTLFQTSRGFARTAAMVMTPVAMVPAIVSGSRAGFLALMISLGVLAVQREYRRYLTTYVLAALLFGSINFFYSNSLTKERTEQIGGHRIDVQETMLGRIVRPLGQIVDLLEEHGPTMVVAGGGFYVVPQAGHWRIGYGIHNLFLHPFEQAGLLAFVASLWLWWRMGTQLGFRRYFGNSTALDVRFRTAMFGYFVAMMVVGWAGGALWVGSGTEHLAAYQMIMFCLAVQSTGGTAPAAAPARRRGEAPISPFLEEVLSDPATARESGAR